MITSNTVQVQAPAAEVWAVFADVERWPDWTPSVTSVHPLDGPLALGARFTIRQPRLPRLTWRVVEFEPGRSWVWRAGAAGGRTFAHHLVEPQDDGSTVVTQRIDQRGISVLFGLLSRGLTRRYLAEEAAGLKAACERRPHRAAQS